MDFILMDKFQVIALCLEIIGVTLTFIHIFVKDVSKKIATKLDWFLKWSGLEVLDYGIQDKEDPLEISGFREFYKIIFGIIFIFFVDFGDGFLWFILEFFTAMILGQIAGIVFQIFFLSFFKIVFGSFTIIGKNDIVAGIGVFLTLIGLVIEVIQVWYGSFRVSLFVILAIIIAVFFSIRISKAKDNEPWNK